MSVTHSMVIQKASLICCEFQEKSAKAKAAFTSWWLKANSLIYCMGTTKYQRPPAETTIAEALDYINNIAQVKYKGKNQDPKYTIMNMDQTPIFFTHHLHRTLAKKGQNCIKMLIFTSDTKRAAFIPTICRVGLLSVPCYYYLRANLMAVSCHMNPPYFHRSASILAKRRHG